MKDAEFIVGIVKNQNIDLSNYVAAKEGYHPPAKQSLEGLEIKNGTVVTPDGKATVIFSRLLEPPNRKKIRREQMKSFNQNLTLTDIMAYNPMSSAFGYHEHNRQMILISFYTNEISASSGLQNTRFFHGLGMFLA
ncbi:unnamed protein product [Rhizophagus irregularis]|nr:unnamed protein product [Rhizophagus irregularis]CAB4428613.1 unnamed protein product [Rhizophagus irregularis]